VKKFPHTLQAGFVFLEEKFFSVDLGKKLFNLFNKRNLRSF
jgi:hypothetical protein